MTRYLMVAAALLENDGRGGLDWIDLAALRRLVGTGGLHPVPNGHVVPLEGHEVCIYVSDRSAEREKKPMILERDGRKLFALGMYERPRTDDEWRRWSEAGINLVCCHSRDDLDLAHEWGMFGWVPVPMILSDDDDGSALADRIDELKDHPALAVWEAPDEAIWHAHRQETNWATKRLWSLEPDALAEVNDRLDALVRGLARGSRLIRGLDPGRPLWLNESGCHQLTLARCVPYLDVVGFDGYPVPYRVEKPLHHLGIDTARFRAIAPGREIWMVQQGFSWSSLGQDPSAPVVYPTVEQYRFMAWQAIARGATGLLWWGSAHEDRPAPFLDDLMSVVAEFADLHELLDGGEVISVHVEADTRSYPATSAGVRHMVRRAGDRTMLVLVNEDPFEQDGIISGIDWVEPTEMRPVARPSADLTRIADGFITPMQGYEARVYVTD